MSHLKILTNFDFLPFSDNAQFSLKEELSALLPHKTHAPLAL
jgi:hypothetical protein